MSEFFVEAVSIGKIGKHPNADSLSITQVRGRYPVIIKTGAFQPGDTAIHIPPDALVPVDRPEFAFLADKAKNGLYRVKFSKLRGVPSYGFLVPVPAGESVVVGQDVREMLGVTKYDPGPCYQLGSAIAGEHLSIPQEGVVPHYDIEGLRKYEGLLAAGEDVVATEKIHGSNARFVYLDGALYCGSRTRFRKNSVWNRMAEKYSLEAVLSRHPGLVLYGEVYGSGIQDLAYGLKDEQRAVFFDVYDARRGVWFNTAQFEEFCANHGLPTVPVLYRGPFDLERMYELAEGTTVLGGGCHVREGVVIKPVEERWDQQIGRVFVKLVGEGYLLRKGG